MPAPPAALACGRTSSSQSGDCFARLRHDTCRSKGSRGTAREASYPRALPNRPTMSRRKSPRRCNPARIWTTCPMPTPCSTSTSELRRRRGLDRRLREAQMRRRHQPDVRRRRLHPANLPVGRRPPGPLSSSSSCGDIRSPRAGGSECCMPCWQARLASGRATRPAI